MRFLRADDADLASLMIFMAQENIILNHFLNKAQLSSWIQAVLESVKEELVLTGEAEDVEMT